MKMLHWPDSMATPTGDEILFGNDAFGQHYCDQPIQRSARPSRLHRINVYVTSPDILTPFAPLVKAKIRKY
ncbi:hypothetical protein O9993_09585 [Vibrio lentus]|nr:hypothetical protein [Vibrio lentus]